MSQVVYILGPMSGYPQHNRPAFRKAAEMLRQDSTLHVISPDELDNDYPVKDEEWAAYMRRDLAFVAQATVGVALPGWRRSPGATLEAAIFRHLGSPVYELSYKADENGKEEAVLTLLDPGDLPRIVH